MQRKQNTADIRDNFLTGLDEVEMSGESHGQDTANMGCNIEWP